MSFDGFFTHHMVHELNKQLAGGRISKIHQPYQNEIILVIRSQGKNHKLLLSAHPNFARIQLTKIPYDNPSSAPNFCMMLRKYLDNAILDRIEQLENDRIVHLHFSRRNELGDLEDITLIAEMMGRHSALVLVNRATGKILDCIKHIGPSQNSYRLLLPGSTYIEPPADTTKLNPFTTDKSKLFDTLSTLEALDTQHIQTAFQGLGSDTASEISYQLEQSPNEKLNSWEQFITKKTDPTWYQADNKELFSPVPFEYVQAQATHFETLSEMLDAFYYGKAERDRVKQQASELIKKMSAEIKRNKKKISILNKELLATEKADTYRIKGELLTSYLHLISNGMTTITLTNYYDNQPIDINLDPQLSPSQNAQKYYKRYNKLKNGAEQIESQLTLAKQEKLYLESIMSQLDLASPSDINAIREELIASGYLKNRQKKAKKDKPSKPDTYLSSDGTQILVGKNNLQNDQLTFKLANKTDIWLHAKDIPGSHVIIKSANPSDETLEEAAILAAYHSKYRLSSQVPVDYVAAKFVHKPNGAKPGFVIYENQKTLYVTPEMSKIDLLKSN
ncbi:NFACT RNA binding domain-containing protein [Vagococcus xieshaowenii]|uniref:Rqc2 homolog RqcH n=1 Tax=Vagococcus xieshaowenii TaxID=2562451 RepID=A0A4Z0DD13_9ENTE|nr:NFACT RNA binding domain-containing protein [Vagococcus xieshaowenii]QCA28409.1 fibronectin/fibrinogen-binding protein [Vagococcus xieshaowenii]TFZ42835.1 fibronectin/fibrinogen-binding protein [Vagococcus xieshaowenii]